MQSENKKSPRQLAWEASFLDENHLNHATSPDLVASSAQIRFMVALEPEEHYYPCTEKVYEEIMARVNSPSLGEMYSIVWSRIKSLVEKKIDDPELQAFLIDRLNIKHQHEIANFNTIPSRLEKRLFKMFMTTTQIEDPLSEEKEYANRKIKEIFLDEGFRKAVNMPPGPHTPASCFPEENLESRRRQLDAEKIQRLCKASVQYTLWDGESEKPDFEAWKNTFGRPVEDDGWEELENFLLTPRKDMAGHWEPRRILYLADSCGEIIFDLAIIKTLIRLGHVVILAIKNAAIYEMIYMGDIMNDPVLKDWTSEAEIITNNSMTKNEMAARLRSGNPFLIITDGSMEIMNLSRTSVTFARAFREVDGIISKGLRQRRRFFDTKFEFTQDIFNLAPGANGTLSVKFRPKSTRAARFSSAELENMAGEIIKQMRNARDEGKTVMFYSGVVGSIPGETDTAIKVMSTFVKDLEKQQAGTFIINPSSYFEPGMDADDLMYMWEIVQRSGYINIWRFQTYQDIEKSFALMKKKVPPQWVGKDSTFSTGCTKEMAIAMDVQKKNPEMQIIGPDHEKFMRRGEYGIGLFHDKSLTEIFQH